MEAIISQSFEGVCEKKVNKSIDENQKFLEHNVIKSFLSHKKYNQLFLETISYDEFKKYYVSIRFTAFISSTLYFNAINYDKRHRKTQNRYQLTLDKLLGVEQELSFKDLIEDPYSEIEVDSILQSSDIRDYIVDPTLVKAIEKLTDKQKEVIDLAYVTRLSDTEIGAILGKSQQAISKLHKRALKSIYNFLQENG
ncbi:sigma-70 family RNA polymerase sigma factor [Cerasibacillus sp. JNUCC 74]